MNRLTLMSVLCLTACALRPDPVQIIPAELTRKVVVTCASGDTSRALGQCALALREGLNVANDKLGRIAGINTTGVQ